MSDKDARAPSTAYDFGSKIKYVCKKFANREGGSESERDASDFLSERVAACTDTVEKDRFAVFPSAYMSETIITPTAFILAYAAYFFSTLVAAVLLIVGCAVYIGEFLLCKRMLDPLFVKATSQNVTGVRRASEDANRSIYLVAHVDASREWRLKRRLGGMLFTAQQASNFIGSLYLIGITVARWALVGGVGAGIAEGVMLWMGVAGAIFLFGFISTYFFMDGKQIVDGANDGLSGVGVAIETLKALEEKGIRLKNTNVGIILTGSSCCGLRGAKDWCEKHAADCDKENTVFIALNCLRESKAINVGTTEMRGIVRSDRDTIDSVLSVAKNVGVECTARSLPFGVSTDSAAFTQAGLRSISITAMNKTLPDYYRTKYDSYDNLSEECMEECVKLLLGYIEEYSGEDVLSHFDLSKQDLGDPFSTQANLQQEAQVSAVTSEGDEKEQ